MGALTRRPRLLIAGAVVVVLGVVLALWLPGYLERRELTERADRLINRSLELCLERATTSTDTDRCLAKHEADLEWKEQLLDR